MGFTKHPAWLRAERDNAAGFGCTEPLLGAIPIEPYDPERGGEPVARDPGDRDPERALRAARALRLLGPVAAPNPYRLVAPVAPGWPGSAVSSGYGWAHRTFAHGPDPGPLAVIAVANGIGETHLVAALPPGHSVLAPAPVPGD